MAEYDKGGDAIFQILNGPRDTTYHDAELYVLVVNENHIIVAHDADPGAVGTVCASCYTPDATSGAATLQISHDGTSGVLAPRIEESPVSRSAEYKVSWIKEYDGHLFGRSHTR